MGEKRSRSLSRGSSHREFPAGMEVEVKRDDDDEDDGGGAWHEAVVLRSLPTDRLRVVQYHSPNLEETAPVSNIRPRPPRHGSGFRVHDAIDAFHAGCWREGVIASLHSSPDGEDVKGYTVSFPSKRQVVRFNPDEVRSQLRWLRSRSQWVVVDNNKRGGKTALLSPGDSIEVARGKDLHRAAWFTAKVVKVISKSIFTVEYDLLHDDEFGHPLNEIVHIKYTRPPPPQPHGDESVAFPLQHEVEAFHGNGWCPGKVVKVLSKSKYVVGSKLFRLEFDISNLRRPQYWSYGKWIDHVPGTNSDGRQKLQVGERSSYSSTFSASRDADEIPSPKRHSDRNSSGSMITQPSKYSGTRRTLKDHLQMMERNWLKKFSQYSAKTNKPDPPIENPMETQKNHCNGLSSTSHPVERLNPSEPFCVPANNMLITRVLSPCKASDDGQVQKQMESTVRLVTDSEAELIPDPATNALDSQSELMPNCSSLVVEGFTTDNVNHEHLQKEMQSSVGGDKVVENSLGNQTAEVTEQDGFNMFQSDVESRFLSSGHTYPAVEAAVPLLNSVTQDTGHGFQTELESRAFLQSRHEVTAAEMLPLPFTKKHPLWNFIESLEVFHSMRHRPHFQALEHYSELFREGMAVGLMVTFSNFAKSVHNLSISDPESDLENMLKGLISLDSYGFDVQPIQHRVERLLEIKRKQTQSLKNTTALKEKLSLLLEKKIQLNTEVVSHDKSIVDLQDKLTRLSARRADLLKMHECRECEITALQMDANAAVTAAEHEFSALVAAQW